VNLVKCDTQIPNVLAKRRALARPVEAKPERLERFVSNHQSLLPRGQNAVFSLYLFPIVMIYIDTTLPRIEAIAL